MTITNELPPNPHKIVDKKLSYGLLALAIVGGIGGAVMLGILLEDIARSLFGLKEPNFILMGILGSVVGLLSAIGTGVLVVAFYIQNKAIKTLTIAFSLPIPIVIEIVDLTLRFMNLIPDVYAHYSVPI